MVVGALALVIGFLSAPNTVEEAKAMVADAHGHGDHNTYDTHADDHTEDRKEEDHYAQDHKNHADVHHNTHDKDYVHADSHDAHDAHGGGHGDSHDKHLCLLYTSPSPRDRTRSRMPSSA